MSIWIGDRKIETIYFGEEQLYTSLIGMNVILNAFKPIPLFFETTAGEYQYTVRSGIEYLVIARGAGGAGGTNGTLRATAGKGGAGSKGKIIQGIVSFPESTTATCVVGLRGMAGGGGEPGQRVESSGGVGGYGGGAGMPSYIRAGETTAFTTMYELQVTKYGWTPDGTISQFKYRTASATPQAGDKLILINADSETAAAVVVTVVGTADDYSTLTYSYYGEHTVVRTPEDDVLGNVPSAVYTNKSIASALAVGDVLYYNSGEIVGSVAKFDQPTTEAPDQYRVIATINNVRFGVVPTMTPTPVEKIVPNIPVYANGGAGGGGGGGGADGQRYVPGGSGGGGGDRAYLDTDTGEVVVVKGKTGARGTYTSEGSGIKGSDGDTVNFPAIRSGGGGTARNNTIPGSAASSGAGASGGSGGPCSNHASNGGGGGGGAGGDDEAGGGSGGGPNGGTATNHYTTPKAVRDANMVYGVDTDSGIGGGTEQDGQDGFLMIVPLRKDKIRQYINCGRINETIDETIDCGFITKDVDNTIDYGNYDATIESVDNGNYGATEAEEDYGKIFIPADITETINNGVIYA